MTRLVPTLLLALTVVMLYFPLAQYGYVQDDLLMIQSIVSSGMPNISPVDKPFYRPLGWLYCYAVFMIFGMNATGFHVLAMLLLLTTALFVELVAYKLTKDGWVAWGSAFLYVVATNIHLDPQMWMVGIYDIGATLFALLCLFTFMRGWYYLSALSFVLALGFKESAAAMLCVVVAYNLIFHSRGKAFLWAWPHLAVFTIWAIFKSFGVSLFDLPGDNPYASKVLGWHILENIGLYVTWFAPLTLGTVLVIAMMASACYTKPRIGWFLVVWALLMLLPASIILHHAFRYYTMLALPAIAIGVSAGIMNLPIAVKWKRGMIVFAVVTNFLLGLGFIQGHVRRGINDDIPAIDDGYNHLIRKSLRGK